MSGAAADDMLAYYLAELSHLREAGAEFAHDYPKVARRLELGRDECPDPHVERLIESFAFLTGRIQRRLDDEFPEVASALLGVLYPHLTAPVPSATVARFEVDPAQGKLSTGYPVARHTPLFAQTPEGLLCRFRTCYPVTLWPLRVREAVLESSDRYRAPPRTAAVLRIRLENTADEPCRPERLRFYLNGQLRSAGALYELLAAHVVGVAARPVDGEPVDLGADALRPVGFAPDEEVLPYPPHAHPGYRLVQEYFAFPHKYLFADVAGLDRIPPARAWELLVFLDARPPDWLAVGRDTFQLGCTPVVNLFRRTTEPLRLDHRRSEYRLVPDVRRERTTEVHTVLRVSCTSDAAADEGVFDPFYSLSHRRTARAFWHARRVPTGRRDVQGSDTLLSFVDLDSNPARPRERTVWAHTLCTNRRLAEQLPPGHALQIEEAAPLHRITVLNQPTPQIDPPLGGAAQWRLVSALSLGHLSLTGPGALDALREILRLYGAFSVAGGDAQVDGLREMAVRRVVRRAGEGPWRGLVRGTEVTLTFDEEMYPGTSALLLGAVLARFLALYASINSFTETVARSRQRPGEWKRWPPMAGEETLL